MYLNDCDVIAEVKEVERLIKQLQKKGRKPTGSQMAGIAGKIELLSNLKIINNETGKDLTDNLIACLSNS